MIYAPIALLPARAWRSYKGGRLIAQLHGVVREDDHYPEEWLMSVVRARNVGRADDAREGLSLLADGQGTLSDILLSDPVGMLGAGKTSPGVLMKLLDAAERLSVQVHPSRTDARRLFHSEYGKTECWHVLGGRTMNGEAPYILFGFKKGVTREIWRGLFMKQDIPGMLSCLHRFPIHEGETYLIEGGVPHAIGPGCFLAEIQEPTDLTLRTERTGPSGESLPDASCHQGAGFENMLDCFAYGGYTAEETLSRWKIAPRVSHESASVRVTTLLDYTHTPFFRLEKVFVSGRVEIEPRRKFYGFYVLSGNGELVCGGQSAPLTPGTQYFLPAQCPRYTLQASDVPLTLLRYYGPKDEEE